MPAFFLIALAAGAAPVAAAPAADFDPRRMKPSEIRTHNASLDRKDPNFIRCVAQEETGSLVRKSVSCRTNAQWASSFKDNNQNARDTYDSMVGKAVNQSN
ncbi:hypothetical protein [Novosphingobium sp. FKTRR1]|uniref:hypothetical protein n=1 Tax=Novosphingobium sp. FKTRR1 TaxID=2879118 RepID=UPI001CF095C7|nr:hypothetical protein [Novosphingobium sp. FKTRR1]